MAGFLFWLSPPASCKGSISSLLQSTRSASVVCSTGSEGLTSLLPLAMAFLQIFPAGKGRSLGSSAMVDGLGPALGTLGDQMGLAGTLEGMRVGDLGSGGKPGVSDQEYLSGGATQMGGGALLQ